MHNLTTRLDRLEAALPEDEVSPPSCIFYLPDNGRDDKGPGRYRIGSCEMRIYNADDPNCPFRPPPDPRFPEET